jgi:hypothetical protein
MAEFEVADGCVDYIVLQGMGRTDCILGISISLQTGEIEENETRGYQYIKCRKGFYQPEQISGEGLTTVST